MPPANAIFFCGVLVSSHFLEILSKDSECEEDSSECESESASVGVAKTGSKTTPAPSPLQRQGPSSLREVESTTPVTHSLSCQPPPFPARPHELTQHNQPPPLRKLNFAKLTGSGAVIVCPPVPKKGANAQHPESNVVTHRSPSWAGACSTSLS